MKRIISVILAVLALSMLASCRKNEEKTENDTTLSGFEDATSSSDKGSDSEVSSDEAPGKPAVEDPADVTSDSDETSVTEADAATDASTERPDAPEDTTAPLTDTMTEEKAVTLARDFIGQTDPATGYPYSFRFDSVTADGEYLVKVSRYLADDDRWALCGYVLVTPDGKVSKFNW